VQFGHLDAPPDRRLDVQQRDLELVDQVALLRGRLAGGGSHAVEDAGMFLRKQVGDFVQDGDEPLLVRAGGVQGGLAEFVVQVVQFLQGEADDQCAFPGMLEAFLHLVLDPGGVDHALSLLPGEPERVGFIGLLSALEAERDRSRIVARRQVTHRLGDLAPGLLDGEGLAVVGCFFAGHGRLLLPLPLDLGDLRH
jgi:hypothetical protein